MAGSLAGDRAIHPSFTHPLVLFALALLLARRDPA